MGAARAREPVDCHSSSTRRGSSSSPTRWSRRPASRPMLHRLVRRADHGRRRESPASSPRARPAARRSWRKRGHRRDGRRRRRPPRRRADAHDAAGGDDGGLGDVLTWRRRQGGASSRASRPIRRRTRTGPAAGNGTSRPSGKEDDMFSPFLRKPFEQAMADGLIPPTLHDARRHLGRGPDTGELTYLNLVHLDGDRRDRPRRSDARRDRGPPPGDATRSRRCGGTCPGASDARLRNFGMTLGIRDTRKIDAALQHDRSATSASRAGSTTRSGSSRVHRRLRHPDPADDRALLPAPVRAMRAKGRRATFWSPAVRSAVTGSRMRRRATCRAARCWDKAPASPRPSRCTATSISTPSTSRRSRKNSTARACATSDRRLTSAGGER